MSQEKILVLLSGGLDSSTLLHMAVKRVGAENVKALGMYYGQKHAKEKECAEWQATELGVPFYLMDLQPVFGFNPNCSALLAGSEMDIVHKSYADQLGDLGGSGTVTAYVPYRNGLFLSTATSVAIQLGCNLVAYGAHADDAAGSAYPDCTPEFIEAQTAAIEAGTSGEVLMWTPFWNINKAGIVKLGLESGMTPEDFKHTWSCYEGGEKPCGSCGTCIDRKQAFLDNGLTDQGYF